MIIRATGKHEDPKILSPRFGGLSYYPVLINVTATDIMTRDELLDISTNKIKNTLSAYIPADVPVYIFGSRSRRDNRWNSDFDLWIDADLPRTTITAVIEQLDESIVPFKVDLITTAQLSGAFGTEIKREAKRWI